MRIHALLLALVIVLVGGDGYAAPRFAGAYSPTRTGLPQAQASKAQASDVERINGVCARYSRKCVAQAAGTELIVDFDHNDPTSTDLFREILDTLKIWDSPDSPSTEPFSRYVLQNINIERTLRLNAATIDLPIVIKDSVFGVNKCGSPDSIRSFRIKSFGLNVEEWKIFNILSQELNGFGDSAYDLEYHDIKTPKVRNIIAKLATRKCLTDSSSALLDPIFHLDTSEISRSIVFQDTAFFGGFELSGSRIDENLEFVGVNFYGPVTLTDNKIMGRLRFQNDTFFRNLSIGSSQIERGLTLASNTHAIDIGQPVLCPLDGGSSSAMLQISLTTTAGLVRVVGSRFLRGRPNVSLAADHSGADENTCYFAGRGVTILRSRAEQGFIFGMNKLGCSGCAAAESTQFVMQEVSANLLDIRDNYFGDFFSVQNSSADQFAVSSNHFVGGVYIFNNVVDGSIALEEDNWNVLAGKVRIEGNDVGGELSIAPAAFSEIEDPPAIRWAGPGVPVTVSGNQVGRNLMLTWWDREGMRPNWLDFRWNTVKGKLNLQMQQDKEETKNAVTMVGCLEGGDELQRFVDLSYTTVGTLVWKMPIDCERGWSGLGLSFTQWLDARFREVTDLNDGSGVVWTPEEEIKAMEAWRTTIVGNGSGGAPEIAFLGDYLGKLSHRKKGREWVGDAKEIDYRPELPEWLAPGPWFHGAVVWVSSQLPEGLGRVFSHVAAIGSRISSLLLFLMSVVVYLYLLPSDFGTRPQLALALYVITIFVFAFIYGRLRFERSEAADRNQTAGRSSLADAQPRFEHGGIRLRRVDALMYSVDAAIPIISLRMLDRYQLVNMNGLRYLQQVLALWFATAFLSAITIL